MSCTSSEIICTSEKAVLLLGLCGGLEPAPNQIIFIFKIDSSVPKEEILRCAEVTQMQGAL